MGYQNKAYLEMHYDFAKKNMDILLLKLIKTV